jgi:hypothetical protein
MAAGRQVDRPEINSRAGGITATLYIAMREIKVLQGYLAATPDATLVAMGFTSQDVADLKSAFVDMDELRKAWDGVANSKLTGTYAFQTFPSRLIGDGII